MTSFLVPLALLLMTMHISTSTEAHPRSQNVPHHQLRYQARSYSEDLLSRLSFELAYIQIKHVTPLTSASLLLELSFEGLQYSALLAPQETLFHPDYKVSYCH